ncbi:MAG: hypothetical protein OJF49_002220 [Ktedonobacterales bacterium]|jgi:hypothetical protein|nr:MAG: hypothetical protein OJF49_002220 [Ktedonobacterales bacterium]
MILPTGTYPGSGMFSLALILLRYYRTASSVLETAILALILTLWVSREHGIDSVGFRASERLCYGVRASTSRNTEG